MVSGTAKLRIGRVLFTSVVVILSATPLCVFAGEHYRSHSPVYFKAASNRALVYFVNDLTDETVRVHVDGVAIGYLPTGAYTAASVRPGPRLVWGTSTARWHRFKPGWTYVLRLVSVGAIARAWASENPGMIGALVADKGLVYVTTDRRTLERLQTHAAKAYRDALTEAGDQFALPHQRRFHRLDPGGKPSVMTRAGH
ncbi:MAG: hypothetical protein ACE5K1_07710 [Acidiferrobacterales bacterium]